MLVSFISPYRAERQMARGLLPKGEFIEVFVDTPIEECRRRDPKGLYAKVDAGLIRNLPGLMHPTRRRRRRSYTFTRWARRPRTLRQQS